jgi:hypothetical protein
MSAAGSGYNVQWGFEVGDTSLVTVAGTSVGMLSDSITVRVPRDIRFLDADQSAVRLDHTVAKRDAFVAFTMQEVLGGNLAAAWDTGAYTSSSVDVNDTEQGQVALVVNTKGPDGSTRTVTMGKAVSIGEGTWTLPFAVAQTIAAEFQAVGDLANDGRILMSVDS